MYIFDDTSDFEDDLLEEEADRNICKKPGCNRTAGFDKDYCYRHMYSKKDDAYKERKANHKPGGFYKGRRKK